MLSKVRNTFFYNWCPSKIRLVPMLLFFSQSRWCRRSQRTMRSWKRPLKARSAPRMTRSRLWGAQVDSFFDLGQSKLFKYENATSITLKSGAFFLGGETGPCLKLTSLQLEPWKARTRCSKRKREWSWGRTPPTALPWRQKYKGSTQVR